MTSLPDERLDCSDYQKLTARAALVGAAEHNARRKGVMMADWLHLALHKTRCMPTKYNWDSYGGDPPTQGAIWRTRLLLREFAAIGFPAPQLGPTPNGGMYVFWGDELLNIDIHYDCAVMAWLFDRQAQT